MAEPHAAPVAVGPRVGDETIAFSLADPNRRLVGVELRHELDLPGQDTRFGYDETAGAWTLTLPRPPIRRMEYQLTLYHPDGASETVTDPTNPVLTPGAFGDKSVLGMPDYAAPAWLAGEQAWPIGAELNVSTGVGPVEITVLSPDEPTSRLLVAHDGPEYDRLAALGRFAATMVRHGRVPPFHLALATPGARDERYSANPAYATAMVGSVLPELRRTLGTDGPVVLMGASLGGLAALHIQRRHPTQVAGLFLQSGSFFVPQYDEVEKDFRYYNRIIRYVAAVLRGQGSGRAVPTTLTCGTAEENVHNNRLMAATLRRQGYPATLHEVPDAHNYVAWRDSFDPYLVDLLAKVWADSGTRWGDGGRVRDA
ncbi:MAG TPA: alpha/beta hydrolase-fold protein [Actinophytocola sp.]|uniref:alpha/beta hydrolase n=1 Tax=Actinophytocola sp. TaxID=1872138 RepID=UPI002DDD8E8C|nr:alpha/beta hydrolase-fold protein [Actinophytocola sp.]HEV2781117.1 alpha/beta hydrolase-fold protein [Actinophytocola sp.]